MKTKRAVFLGGAFLMMASLILPLGCAQEAETESTTLTPPTTQVPETTPADTPTHTPTPPTTQSPETTPELEPGWTLYEEQEEGFEIALPDRWRVTTEEQEQPGGDLTIIFYAKDPVCSQPVLDFDGSFSVMKLSRLYELSLAELAIALKQDLEDDSTTVGEVSIRQVELSVGEAAECIHTQDYPHRTGHVIFLQYFLIKDKEVYALTSETVPDLFEKYKPIFETIAQSFQLSE